MKNILFVLTTITIITSACDKKNDDAKPEENTYKVSFSTGLDIVSESSQKTAGSQTLAEPPAPGTLQYRIYDASTGRNMTASRLPAGNYIAAFLASKGPGDTFRFSATDPRIPPSGLPYYEADQILYPPSSFSAAPNADTFYKKINFTISRDTIIAVTLERIVAGLELIIEDAPVGVGRLTITAHSEASSYDISTDQRLGSHDRLSAYLIPPSQQSVANQSFTNYLFKPHDGLYTVTIKTTAGEPVGPGIEKVIHNVPFYVNRKTTLRGKLFGTSTSATTFSIKVNSDWGPPTGIVTF